jgi:hypothetical protein
MDGMRTPAIDTRCIERPGGARVRLGAAVQSPAARQGWLALHAARGVKFGHFAACIVHIPGQGGTVCVGWFLRAL